VKPEATVPRVEAPINVEKVEEEKKEVEEEKPVEKQVRMLISILS